MPAGQPTKLTPEVLEEFKRLLPTVLYLETVGDYLQVHRTTWRLWLRRGRKEADRLAKNASAKPKKTEAIYLEFFYIHKKAIAEGEIHDAGIIKQASKAGTRPVATKRTTKPDGTVVEETRYAAGEWTAAAWRLERRFGERWGSNSREVAELKEIVHTLLRDAAAQGKAPQGPPAGPSEPTGSRPPAEPATGGPVTGDDPGWDDAGPLADEPPALGG